MIAVSSFISSRGKAGALVAALALAAAVLACGPGCIESARAPAAHAQAASLCAQTLQAYGGSAQDARTIGFEPADSYTAPAPSLLAEANAGRAANATVAIVDRPIALTFHKLLI